MIIQINEVMIDYLIIVVIFADDREVLYCLGRLEVEQVVVELLIDHAHVFDRHEVMHRILVRLGVFDDVGFEDLADHVLPGPPLTHVVELNRSRIVHSKKDSF